MVERQGLGFRGLLTKTLNDGKDTQRGSLPEYDGDFKGPRISLWFHISPHWIAVFPAGTQDVPLALLESFEILVVPLVSVVVACFGAPIFSFVSKNKNSRQQKQNTTDTQRRISLCSTISRGAETRVYLRFEYPEAKKGSK